MPETTSLSAAPDLVKVFTACRACGSGNLDVALDLGIHAVSDFVSEISGDELRAPLMLLQCADCGLVQLSHSVSRDRLYRNYWYRSGLNPAMVAALKDVVDDAMGQVALKKGDLVLDIGANDGTLLDRYPDWVRTIGVEPSDLAGEAAKRHIVYRDYYPAHYPIHTVFLFKIITSIAMFYDLDDPNAFLRTLRLDLDDDGVWVNQMMDLDGMLAANAFDNVCHEHVTYWRNEVFANFVAKHDLKVAKVSRNAVNGGSVRHTMRHGKGASPATLSSRWWALRDFAHRVRDLRDDCLHFLELAKQQHKTVIGYGASTKGNTLLQYYGITPHLLPAIAERNPDKVGKYTAGSHIPIISEEEMRERKPDYLLILPWHFLKGFLEREKDLRDAGTRFIVPLPTFDVV